MAISGTYLSLQTQIIDELGDRSDLLPSLRTASTNSPVKRAIQSAIAKWEREPFYFLEKWTSPATIITTIAGQSRYGASDLAELATDPYIYHLRITIGDTRTILTKRTWLEIDAMESSATARGQPTDWAYFGKEIRLYPTPDGVYTVQGARIAILTTLSADADTNVWLTDAWDLIKAEAKMILGRDILRDPVLVADMQKAIYGDPAIPRDRGYLGVLKAETTRRAKSRIRPTYF